MTTPLIDRYLHEVGQLLPEKMREDVQLELRSLLADSLEERAKTGARIPDEDLMAEVLKDFGPPKEVAARYAPVKNPLIEPALIPVMNLIILLNMVVIWGYAVYSLGSPALPGETTILIRGEVLDAVTSTVLSLLITTGAFILISKGMASNPARAWDPRALPPLELPDRVNRPARFGQMGVIVILMILFNFFPDWVGAPYLLDGRWQFVPWLASSFREHLPWLNLLGISLLVLNGVVLRIGRWSLPAKWLDVGVSGVAALVFYRLLAGSPFTHSPALNEFFKGMFLVFLVSVVIEMGVNLYKLMTAISTK
jgi:hypothetical protein